MSIWRRTPIVATGYIDTLVYINTLLADHATTVAVGYENRAAPTDP
jgi:hypothetical protein